VAESIPDLALRNEENLLACLAIGEVAEGLPAAITDKFMAAIQTGLKRNGWILEEDERFRSGKAEQSLSYRREMWSKKYGTRSRWTTTTL
jgi:hypothetical protein